MRATLHKELTSLNASHVSKVVTWVMCSSTVWLGIINKWSFSMFSELRPAMLKRERRLRLSLSRSLPPPAHTWGLCSSSRKLGGKGPAVCHFIRSPFTQSARHRGCLITRRIRSSYSSSSSFLLLPHAHSGAIVRPHSAFIVARNVWTHTQRDGDQILYTCTRPRADPHLLMSGRKMTINGIIDAHWTGK